MYAGEIAEDRDAGHILAMKGEDAGRLWTEVIGTIGRRNVAMNILVVLIVGGGDLGQQTSDHLDDIGDWHGADLELPRLGAMAREMGSL